MSPSAGTHVPLLTGTNSAAEPGSVPGAVFNVATTIIGAGIMSIPAILKVLGVFPSFALILIVAILAEVSVEFLLRFTHAGETTTYSGVMREAFGSYGAISVQGMFYLERKVEMKCTWEFCSSGLGFTGGIQGKLLFSSPCSAISTLLAVAFVAICSGLAIVALVQGKTQTPKLVPRLDYQTSFFDLFTAVPVVVTAFTFHFNVHPIGFELAKPSDMKIAVRLAIMFCAFIYFTIGLFGYLLFGDSTQSDILINFDQSSDSTVGSLCNSIIRVSYALHIMLVFPILNFSLRANIDELLFPKKPLLATDNKRFVIITLVLLVFSYLAAIAIPDIWYFFQFLGSTTALCLAFIFPGTIALR
ncbi:hypothetical protein TSUD_150060 [Trifolium subterraneum]|uniref:Amino acid transporter transmembrane domain-containing protein n=1 Tax=Trifolium subterraneum TaxID=3900 RepID=A0A2Z6MAB7_TRISU|nr:hypothetical protein TSUD_150060 [Trifolium subterraneum]